MSKDDTFIGWERLLDVVKEALDTCEPDWPNWEKARTITAHLKNSDAYQQATKKDRK